MERIWQHAFRLTNRLRPVNVNNVEDIIENAIIGASLNTDPLVISIHAEILDRILTLKEDATYLIHPLHQVKLALKKIAACELREEVKSKIEDLLQRNDDRSI